MYCLTDEFGEVIQTFPSDPNLNVNFSVFNVTAEVGDYIINGANIGKPQSQFARIINDAWVIDTVAEQADAQAQQDREVEQQALDSLSEPSFRVGSTINNVVINAAGNFARWNVVEKSCSWAQIDPADDTKLVVSEDIPSARIGGLITSQSAGQRFQAVPILVVNGIQIGEMGIGYQRNAGESYDFWPTPTPNIPESLDNGDEIQILVATREQATFGLGGSLNGSIYGANSKLWILR